MTHPANPIPIRLLCVEDNPDDVELMAIALERADPAAPLRAAPGRRRQPASSTRCRTDFDVILCDFNLPRFSPYAALQILVARRCGTPLVVVTRAIGEEAAVHVLRCGAKDYLTKDKLGTLPQIIERVMTERRRRAGTGAAGRANSRRPTARLKKLSARLVVAQERERTLISRELHDQLGQTLTGMVIHLHAAKRTADPDAARKHTDTAMEMAQARRQAAQDPVVLAAPGPARPAGAGGGHAVGGAAHRRAGRPGVQRQLARQGTGHAWAKPRPWHCGWCRRR